MYMKANRKSQKLFPLLKWRNLYQLYQHFLTICLLQKLSETVHISADGIPEELEVILESDCAG